MKPLHAWWVALALAGSAQAQVQYVPVAIQGRPVPGGGAAWVSFGEPTLNDRGQIAFNAGVQPDAGGLGHGAIYFGPPDAPRLVARDFTPAPGAGGAEYGGLGTVLLNEAGHVSFSSRLGGNGVTIGNDVGLWAGPAASPELVAREGDAAPGAGKSATYRDLSGHTLNDAGQVAFAASLAGPGVGSQEWGVWHTTRLGEFPRLVTRTGAPAPGAPAGSTVASLGTPRLNAAGQIAVAGSIDVSPGVRSDGIWAGVPDDLRLAARTGTRAPGTSSDFVMLHTTGGVEFDDRGAVAFRASLFSAQRNEGIWMGRPGDLQLVALKDTPAPGAGGENFSFLGMPVVNDAGVVAFHANLGTNGRGIWAGPRDALRLVARTGTAAAGAADGVTYSIMGAPFLNDAGAVAFVADLQGPGVEPGNDTGVWVADPSGLTTLVVREGQDINVGGGETRRISFLLPQWSSSTDPQLALINDAGQVTFRAIFTDGTEGLFVATVPEPSAGIAMSCCAAAVALLRRRHRPDSSTPHVESGVVPRCPVEAVGASWHACPRHVVLYEGETVGTSHWSLSVFGLVLSALALSSPARAVDGPAPAEAADLPPPVKLTAQEDHRKMMEALGIASLRRGADGWNRQSPHYQNTDESKANPWPNLPDPLVTKDGRKVTTPQLWWTVRRPEIVEDFDREVYGRVPAGVPKVKWEVVSTTSETVGDIPVTTKRLVGHVDNSTYPHVTVDIQLTLTTPANAAGPVPVIMEFGFMGFGGGPGAGRAPPNRPGPRGPTWQQQVLARGWGSAVISPASIQADNGAGLTQGIIGLCNKGQPRKPEDWGALRAWAWGASRALDYFETDKAVDAKRVGIEGLSRYGKAALVAMAYDPRFAIALVGSSGEGGAKLHRRNFGELVENLTSSGEYHWMAGNFLKYGGPKNAGDLPVDAHQLIALCAPRPVFISYGASTGPGAEGTWVDQRGSFMAALAAGPVYELLGKKGLTTNEFPPVEQALLDGELAWRQHAGGHTVGPNWPVFLSWAERYLNAPAAPPAPATTR